MASPEQTATQATKKFKLSFLRRLSTRFSPSARHNQPPILSSTETVSLCHSKSSASFWKRLSLSPSCSDAHGTLVAAPLPPPEPSAQHPSLSSHRHPSSSTLSSELHSRPSSATNTANTSLPSPAEPEHEQDECGLAGIGVRDRRSIGLYSLPLPTPSTPPLIPTPRRYAPSPLSANTRSEPHSSPHAPDIPSRPPSGRRTPTHNRLSLVPIHPSVDSLTLIRILRGPSSYPDETLPRASSHRDSLYVPCV